MQIEIPFNQEIFKKQTDLLYSLQWNNILKKNRKNLYFSFGIFLFGTLIIYGQNNTGYIFVAIALYGFIQFYNLQNAYKKNKKEFQKNIEEEIIGYINSNENSVWEFNESYFRYKDYKYETKIKWLTFKSYRIIEDNIFLDLNANNQLSFIIGKVEVKESDYDKILSILDEKIIKTSP